MLRLLKRQEIVEKMMISELTKRYVWRLSIRKKLTIMLINMKNGL